MQNIFKKWAGALLAFVACFVALPVLAADQILVMTISEYAQSPLQGVKHDAQNALRLAQKLGYNTSQATVLRDQQLTAQGMRQALAQLAERVQSNDRVFIYYSGHGASYLNRSGQCSAALVSQDAQLVDMDELKKHTDQIKAKVHDALVLIDACHSGGLKDLALMSAGGKSRSSLQEAPPAGLSGKAWTPKTGEECEKPVNFTKSWGGWSGTGARSISNADDNFTFIAAAGEQQVALDDKEKGGLATTSLLQCLNEGVKTNGLATPATLSACAQGKVNAAVPELNSRYGTKWLPHDLLVTGNAQRALLDVKTTPVQTTAPQPEPNVAGASSEQVLQSFQQILAGSDGRLSFSVNPTALSVNVALPSSQREVRFPYTSSQMGYGYMLYVGTDGVDMKQLFPDARYRDNNALAPSGEFPATRITNPPGKNTFLFVMSQKPMDFSHIFPAAGAALSPDNLQMLQCAMGSRNAERADGKVICGGQRNAERTDNRPAMGTIEGYAAQLITIEGR